MEKDYLERLLVIVYLSVFAGNFVECCGRVDNEFVSPHIHYMAKGSVAELQRNELPIEEKQQKNVHVETL
jgi:hypothetical protein